MTDYAARKASGVRGLSWAIRDRWDERTADPETRDIVEALIEEAVGEPFKHPVEVFVDPLAYDRKIRLLESIERLPACGSLPGWSGPRAEA